METLLFLEDPYQRTFEAVVLASEGGACTLSRTAFYPGGGGQPHDRGHIVAGGESLSVSRVYEDPGGRVWHALGRDLPPGQAVTGAIDWPYRHALMRQHGLMHIVNAVVREHLGGAITGVQLGPERSRIDFRLAAFARDQIPELERRVNDVILRGLTVTSSVISEAEFERRPELVRTLNVRPPVVDGRVRIVEIEGFDAQACGGTHVHSTRELGEACVVKFDNKGKDNKRFYWELRT